MSEPIRYSEVSNDWNGEAAGLAPSADGELVKYEDYARLHSLFANSEQENARLKADVERLDKQRLKLISICEEAIEWIGVTDFDESPADRLNANLTAICTEKPTK